MDTHTSQSSTVPEGQQQSNATEPKLMEGCTCVEKKIPTDTLFVDILSLMTLMLGRPELGSTRTPLEKAFDSVRQLDTYLADGDEDLAQLKKSYDKVKKEIEVQMKVIETTFEEKRRRIVELQEKDTADRTKAVENLIQLVTQYNIDHPEAKLDVTLSPPLLYQAYILHQDQLKLQERIAKEKASKEKATTAEEQDVTVTVVKETTRTETGTTDGPLYTVVADTTTGLSMKQQEHATKYARETATCTKTTETTETTSETVSTSVTETTAPAEKKAGWLW
jgi:hypothetical protein